MTEVEIQNAIFGCLRQIAPESDPATLRPDQKIRETLDIDSFDFLSLLIALHAKLGVEIPEGDYGKLTTLEEMVRYLAPKAECRARDQP